MAPQGGSRRGGAAPLEPLHGERQRLVELLDDAAGRPHRYGQRAILQRVARQGRGQQAGMVGRGWHRGHSLGEGGQRRIQAGRRHADHHLLWGQGGGELGAEAGQLDRLPQICKAIL